MLGMSKVFKDAGSSVMVDTLQRGQWSSNDLFSSPYHSLQAYVVHSTGVLVPHGDAADQDALDHVAVEVVEDFWQRAKLPQPPQEVQPLLSPLNELCGFKCPSEVLTDVDAQAFKPAHPQHLKLVVLAL